MIGWIKARCVEWGKAKRRINGMPDLTEPPRDGPLRSGKCNSVAGRVKEEGPVGAAIHSDQPAEPLEVMLGDALETAIAIRKAIDKKSLTERQHEVLFVHYAISASIKKKLAILGLSKRCYYERLNAAHRSIEPWFPPKLII